MLDDLTLSKDRCVRRIGLLTTECMTDLCGAFAIAVACGLPPAD